MTTVEKTLNVRQVIDCLHVGITTAAAIGDRMGFAAHTVQATLDALEREGVVMRREDEYRLNPFFREDSRRWAGGKTKA